MDENTVVTFAYIILFAPFAAAVLITLLTLKSKAVSAALSVGSVILGGVLSLALLVHFLGLDPKQGTSVVHEFDWAVMGDISFKIGVKIDFISVLMSCVVGVVGSAIFVYAIGYMKGDPGWSRFFAKFAFFAFSMLGITYATNFLMIFIFWELVGVSSYFLIGYFYDKPSAADAGKKAFMTNRIGDFGMTLGILLIFYSVRKFAGGLDAATLERLTGEPGVAFDPISFTHLKALFTDGALRELLAQQMHWTFWVGAILIFTGAMGKSAQFPLHVWLPDAMEGPTPVSALMHAATMVAAGVYMIVQVFWLFAWAPTALTIVAYIGGITALLAASIAMVQRDIKRILAYSTLSQLGYMVLACGMLGAGAAMFHLTTHAFFKALLFLGAGSVAHACHTYDIFEMGGLAKKMKHTTWTFWVGTLALAGIFPFAGFWSKDEILAAAHQDAGILGFNGVVLYVVAVGVAFMTAFYMGRCCWLTFHGKYRGKEHPHESPKVMWIPLAFLAVCSIFLGFVAAPAPFNVFGEGLFYHMRLLTPTAAGTTDYVWGAYEHGHFHLDIALIGTIVAVAGLFVAWLFYGKRKLSAEKALAKLKPIHTLLWNKYYIDDFYLWLVRKVQQGIAVVMNFVEQHIIIGIMVNGIAGGTKEAGNRLRRMQTGRVNSYVTVVLAGITILVFWLVVSR
ncbi:MAG: NADH-quinone oxidoreductase subunit L [Planctomycetota bacterium]|jgi:NADH-quinone oxidoreductase subunit L